MDDFNENLVKTDNSYGAHLLVDFKPIEDADKLLVQCEGFIQQAQNGGNMSFGAFPRFRNWRTKKRDSKLVSMYATLQPKVVEAEQILRGIIGEVVEKKVALRLQARHLQVRLDACILYNKTILERSDGPLENLRGYVNALSGQSAELKSMILFNKEVLRIKHVESISKGKTFVRWGGTKQTVKKRNITDAELAADTDHQAIELQLSQLRQV